MLAAALLHEQQKECVEGSSRAGYRAWRTQSIPDVAEGSADKSQFRRGRRDEYERYERFRGSFRSGCICVDVRFPAEVCGEGGGGKDTLVDLLSSAGSFLWANGLPNDPVMWDDWRDAYAEATTAGSALNSEFCRAQVNLSDGHLALLDAFSVMMVFLEGIFDRSGEDLQLFEVVGRLMSPLSDSGCLNDSSVWVEWVGSVGKVRA